MHIRPSISGAILSIDEGQGMAAQALGMTKRQGHYKYYIASSFKIGAPPWSNEVIYMVKYTSVAFLIAVPELMARGKMIISWTFKPLETLFWVGVIYVIILSVIAKIVDIIERKLAIPGFQMSRED